MAQLGGGGNTGGPGAGGKGGGGNTGMGGMGGMKGLLDPLHLFGGGGGGGGAGGGDVQLGGVGSAPTVPMNQPDPMAWMQFFQQPTPRGMG